MVAQRALATSTELTDSMISPWLYFKGLQSLGLANPCSGLGGCSGWVGYRVYNLKRRTIQGIGFSDSGSALPGV